MATPEGQPNPISGEQAQPPSMPLAAGSGYEFSARENQALAKLASSMQFVGLFGLAIGILVVAIGVIRPDPWAILSGSFYAVLGLWTHRASVSFRAVVETKGRDISHLMFAIDDLKKLYSVQYWICFLALMIALAAVVGAVVLRVRGQ